MADLEAIKGRWSAAFSGDATADRLTDAQLDAMLATFAFPGMRDGIGNVIRLALVELRERRKLHELALEDIDALVRALERPSGPRCDGDHEPPACASITCWRSPSPDYLAELRRIADGNTLGGYVQATIDADALRWLVDLAERARGAL